MKKAASLLCLAVLFLMLGGCQMIRIEEENRTPLAYTVIEDSQIPEEMQELIREKKETEFQIAYQKGTELFLAKGTDSGKESGRFSDDLSEGRYPVSDPGIWKADERRIQHSGDGSVGICERCFF